ncbi:MAG: hypothetical protein GF411_01770 [Candidatus Lokiarchaeota archaeon]|nr:hypothetical protein [Candidatus Lokiarchaeota archaeon]
MKFSETPICQSRANCYQCRNNERFREQMGKQYGEIECPENLPIGAELEQLPKKSQDAHKRMKEMQDKRQKQIEEAKNILDELEMISSEEGKKLTDKLRSFIFPDTKTPNKCKHGGKKIGEIDEVCCGGTVKKKAAFDCGKHVITTEKKCMNCEDFEK